MPGKLYIKTFGCQMNEYDSDKAAHVLADAHGMVTTSEVADADVILFNTCSVREKAQEKVFHDLGRVRHLKIARPHVLIGVGGCVASQEGAAIVSRAPYVDLVFGPQTLHRLPAMIAARRALGTPQVDISFPALEKFDSLPPARVDGASAFVSIMEGCSKYCSFCVVPYTRGEEVSRRFDDILTEVAELGAQGVKDVTLLGQNVNAYRGVTDDGDSADLALLLEYASEIPGIERLRYTTSHPREFTARLIEAHARLPKLAAHVHLPVQSGSDRVLAAMKRGYTALEYKAIVKRLRAVVPDISITSDFIVGFPGESDADHAATLSLIDEIGFDGSFSFLYSARPGTPAAGLADATPQEVKRARLHEVQQKLDASARDIGQAMIGTRQRVIVEGVARKNAGELAGRTSNNHTVSFSGAARLIGELLEVVITSARPLRGELAPALSPAIN
jgi:tRNA-2-methylthio-N6-dimethylallyladenosine synthase